MERTTKRLSLLVISLFTALTSLAFNVREVDLNDSWDIDIDYKYYLIGGLIFVGLFLLMGLTAFITGIIRKYKKSKPIELTPNLIIKLAIANNKVFSIKENTTAYFYLGLDDLPITVYKGEKFTILKNIEDYLIVKMLDREKYKRFISIPISAVDLT